MADDQAGTPSTLHATSPVLQLHQPTACAEAAPPAGPPPSAVPAPTPAASAAAYPSATSAQAPQHDRRVLEERKARAEELAAKQRKKEAERLLILQQAEADRRERLGLSSSAPSRSAPAAPSAPAAGAASSAPQSVRLQVRCPHWSRTMVFTALSPSDTLGDLRRCVHEELVRGVTTAGDGSRLPSADAQAARVPDQSTIVLVETVPPRRKFVSAEDMQATLQAAGLCPSSALLAEAAPLEPLAPEVPEPQPAAANNAGEAGAGRHRDQDEEEGRRGAEAREEPSSQEDDDNDDHDEEDEDDEEDDIHQTYRRPSGGRNAVHFGAARPGGMYGGSFGANWRFGNRPSAPRPDGPRIGAGGQILSGPPQGAPANSEEQRAAREARLAALERRAGPAQEQPVATAAPAAPAAPAPPSATSGAAPAGYVPEGKKRKEAEKEEILRRIADERADWASRHAPAAGSGATDATSTVAGGAQASGSEEAAKRNAAVEATKRRLENPTPATPAPAPVLPSQDDARVRGQMGGGTNKAQRAKEREAIMRQMEEDRRSWQERQGAVSNEAVVAATAASPATSASAGTGAVRLQVRCAVSGRTASTSAFTAETALGAVRDWAAAELGVAAASVESLALTFPPRTAFCLPEQAGSSLGALGLCPSATLLMKSTAPPAPVEEEQSAPLLPAEQVEERVYIGSFTHPYFGPDSVDIEVIFDSDTAGQWTTLGQTEDIAVQQNGRRIRFEEQEKVTCFEGELDENGVIKGEVIQRGERGGSFVLTPHDGS